MKVRIFAAVLILISTLGIDLTYAQSQRFNEQQLEQLCTQSPFNGRCEGFKEFMYGPGAQAECLFKFFEKEPERKCRVSVTEQGLTVYFKELDSLDFVSSQSRYRQLKIPANQIFAISSQRWVMSDRERNTSVVEKYRPIPLLIQFLNVEVGFVSASNSPNNNRSNILKIFVEETSRNNLNLLGLVNSAPKVLLDNGIITELDTVEPAKDNSQQVKQLLETKQCIKCDLRGANLEKAKLEAANLEGANLEGANLAGADLKNTYLVGANFSKANLTKANLEAAKLMAANLSEANLFDADLQGANLQGANLQSVNLSNANLIAPTMMQDVNLQNANLSEAWLDGANLERANLQNANLEKASLRKGLVYINPDKNRSDRSPRAAEFEFQTNLSNANLQGANLSGANLSKVIFDRTNLQEANLTGTNLKERDLANANICGATMSDGSRSDRTCQ